MWPFNRNTKSNPPAKLHPLTLPAIAPDWTAADVTLFRSFLMSPTGQALLKRARALEYTNAVSACQDSMHTTHSAARAAGFSDAINWLESLASKEMLSRLTGDQVNHTDSGEQKDAAEPERRSF